MIMAPYLYCNLCSTNICSVYCRDDARARQDDDGPHLRRIQVSITYLKVTRIFSMNGVHQELRGVPLVMMGFFSRLFSKILFRETELSC